MTDESQLTDESRPLEDSSPKPSQVEKIEVGAKNLVAVVGNLLREGKVRRISIRNEQGNTLFEVPLVFGVAGAVAGAVFAPVLAAVGAVAAVIAKFTVVVERAPVEDEAPAQDE